MSTTDPPELLTEPEAANLLRLSRRTLQRYRAANTGPAYRRSGHLRIVYPRAELLSWSAARASREGNVP